MDAFLPWTPQAAQAAGGLTHLVVVLLITAAAMLAIRWWSGQEPE